METDIGITLKNKSTISIRMWGELFSKRKIETVVYSEEGIILYISEQQDNYFEDYSLA